MKKSGEIDFDVVIVGGGPAGLSAAIWCTDLGLSSVVIEQESEIGGQLLAIHGPVLNYPGVRTTNGRELRDLVAAQINEIGTITKLQMRVERIDPIAKKVILANGETVSGRYMIIATGVRRRLLGIPGEIEFQGRGMIESGVREASAADGTVVAVIGGGDAALENAAILSKYAKLVYIIHRRSRFSARRSFVDLVHSIGNIRILMNCRVNEIAGNESVERVEIEDLETRDQSSLLVDLVLVRIGVEPNSEALRNSVELDQRGYLIVDNKCETSIDGIFAVGDIANPTAPTISGAVGNGATAAKTIAAKHFADLG